jgi:hypothetical protein
MDHVISLDPITDPSDEIIDSSIELKFSNIEIEAILKVK